MTFSCLNYRRGPGQEYLKFTLEQPLKDLVAQNNLVLEINPVKVCIYVVLR